MTLKKLFILGSALAGAAYLKDKTRRDRFMGQARGFIDKMKTKATEVASDVKAKGSETLNSVSNPAPSSSFTSPSAFGSSSYEASRTYR
jgi:hypothetical protein